MKTILIVLLVICSISLNAQDLCGTEDPETHTMPSPKELQNEILRLQQADKMEPRVFMVSAHIIQSNTGTSGLSQSNLEYAMSKMNEDYAPMNIQFYLCNEVNEIRNSEYLTLEASEGPLLMSQHNVPNTINIYFAPNVLNAGGSNICGNATFTSTALISRRIFMQNSCAYNGSTLSHEMGHFFDLLHTHSTFYGEERVERTDCDNSGDGFCDTPADPRLSGLVSSSCSYTGTELDNFGDAYQPDPLLFMSYSTKACRVNFTAEQQAMVSLTASGANNYLFAECVQVDFAIEQSTESVVVEKFEDTKGSFTIRSFANDNPYELSYKISFIGRLSMTETEIKQESLIIHPGEDIEIEFELPFGAEFYQYTQVKVELDETDRWIETDEDNNEIIFEIDHDYVKEDAVLIFPQPTAEVLNLYLNRAGFSEVEVSVFNSGGQLVLQDAFRKRLTIFNKTYDVSNLLAGMYYIVVQYDDGESETSKFVKI